MKKRLLLLTLLAVALVALFAISASAATTKTLDGTEVTITTYTDAPERTNITISTDDVVIFDDNFACPTAYVFKDQSTISNGKWGSPSLPGCFDFSYINGKTGKAYTFANIVELDMPQGLTSIGTYLAHMNTTLKKVTFPDSITKFGGSAFEACTSIEKCIFEHDESSSLTDFPQYFFSGASSLKSFSMPDSITTMSGEGNHFANCSNLTAVHLSNSLKTVVGSRNDRPSFDYCGKVYFVNEPFTNSIPEKPAIYYFPAELEGLPNQCVFRSCGNLNSILVFGTAFTSIPNNYTFQNTGSNTVVFLADMGNVVADYWSTTTIYFANKENKSAADVETLTGSKAFVFCHAEGNTTHLVEKDLGTEATCITNKFVKSYCFCGTLVEDKEIANTATGIHTFVTNDCTVSVMCTGDEKCNAMSDANENHALVHTLAYANGFDKAGVYNYYCENAGCTIADKAVHDAEKSPIITFKGYSTPETGNVKGINAGFKVEKDLLTLYNDLNEVDATLTIFMVNSKSNDVNISKILDGDTLELADGVKGINVKITSVNYTSISVEVRGFDDSEGGNFYTLNLITAIAVKTDKGVHYVQAGLKNSPNTTQTVDGVDFNIVTANKVYNPAS